MKQKSKTLRISRDAVRSIVAQSVSCDRYHFIYMTKKHICGCCGASHRQMLLIKHKPDCSLPKYRKAMDEITHILTGSGESRGNG